MTVLTAEELEETHPELPSNWEMDMRSIKSRGGPWGCDVCGGPSYCQWRCSKCGDDLVGGGR